MKAAIIAVGSELLGTIRLDTNSLEITRSLEKYGVGLDRKSVVADSIRAIADEVTGTLAACDLIIITGGLGPTEDDVTKDAVALALGLELVEDPQVFTTIKERFAARGIPMAAINAKQALVFPGHQTLVNPRGSAPGFHLTVGVGRNIWIFPGVPYELKGMLEANLEVWLEERFKSRAKYRRAIKIAGMSESAVEEKLDPFYRAHENEPVTILASHGEVQIHLQADGSADEAYEKLNSCEQELRDIFGDRIFGLDDETLELAVGRLLAQRAETVSTAESCTGGLLASRITDVSGSSAYFRGGGVAYSGEAKLLLFGVDPAAIAEHGEVSEQVATQLASGARKKFGTTYGIAITGIAGPTGGSERKPVGTVHIAVSSEKKDQHRQFLLGGSREIIKRQSTQLALDMLRKMILRG